VSWTQITGSLSALPARRGEEPGTYLWIDAGERRERVVAELYLPAVPAEDLDGALGVAVGTIRSHDGEERSGEVRLEFGRVRGGRGVVSARGAGLDSDIVFALSHHPPEGGYCRHCGAELAVDVVAVITPPDGGVIGTPAGRCTQCGD
jgi:hypothetical protein